MAQLPRRAYAWEDGPNTTPSCASTRRFADARQTEILVAHVDALALRLRGKGCRCTQPSDGATTALTALLAVDRQRPAGAGLAGTPAGHRELPSLHLHTQVLCAAQAHGFRTEAAP